MEFKRIRKAVLEEINKRHMWDKPIANQEDLNELMSRNGKNYTGDWETQYKKMCNFTQNKKDKDIKEELDFIKSVEESEDFKGSLVITIDWKTSRMWGANPRAYTNYGFVGSSIGGCGYDKTSTATAEALNDHKPILKELYKMEEKRLNKRNKVERRSFIGYGSGYYAKPYFEGGVGVSSHQDIMENLGFKMLSVTDTPNTNVYMITKQ